VITKWDALGRRRSRRTFLATASAAAATVAVPRAVRAASRAKYRVAVIGCTGRGNYGHGLDLVWLDVPETEVVAVADADPAGLAQAIKRLGNVKGFADYREMLEEVKPDLVSVAARWVDQHCEMVTAAAALGVKGIYLEKPMCRTLAEADQMVAACDANHVKLAMAHQTRYSPKIEVLRHVLESGQLGKILEFRARGKEDARGGGEDLWVLGTHVLDLMHLFGGPPRWCASTVLQAGSPVTRQHVMEGNEGIGPLAGDEVHAMYMLEGGSVGYFDSVRQGMGNPSRFGLRIFGTQGVLEVHNTGYLPDVRLLLDSSWSPGRSGKDWVPVSSAGVGEPETMLDASLHAGNVAAVHDLLAAIAEDRQPIAGVHSARTATEMIVAVFESHRLNAPVALPLRNRNNPLSML